MRPAGTSSRAAYAGSLLAAAQRAGDADVICFLPRPAPLVRHAAAGGRDPGV
jgi:hypothetical protein